ncbi:BBE domain-containing protein [Micromonospora tulbaghiae]|uniref:BBE domain-containing protein n=1 Tax=Micromonospora tulbaghiae TaxID=479978 RepID=UPI003B97CB93
MLKRTQPSGRWRRPAARAEHQSFYKIRGGSPGHRRLPPRGVPVPGEAYSGTYINYPDVDIAEPAWNRSGVPWHAFHYRGNYPRLQPAKRTYDPLGVFHHGLSVRAWE